MQLRVAAPYRRGLGFGDVTLSSATVAGHAPTGLDDHVLIRTTSDVSAPARRRELAALRLVGLTKGQVKRMVHTEQAGLSGVASVIGGGIAAWTLASVVKALTGSPMPYVPPLGLALVAGGAALPAPATTVLPIGRLLRASPVEHIGVKE